MAKFNFFSDNLITRLLTKLKAMLDTKLTGSIEEDGEPVMLVTEDDLNNAVAELEEKIASGGGGVIITDDGEGNVTIVSTNDLPKWTEGVY